MGILRNSINITGITPEDKLPNLTDGKLLEFSEIEHIHTPDNKPRIHTIHQISVKLETIIGRTINSPTGKILILDGVKKFKIVYTQKSKPDKSVVINLELPFNTFIDVPKNSGKVIDIDVHVADAFFSQIGSRKLYSHIIYMINVNYSTDEIETNYDEESNNLAEINVNEENNNLTETNIYEENNNLTDDNLDDAISQQDIDEE